MRERIVEMGATPVIPPLPTGQNHCNMNHLYGERHLVECYINKMKHYRHIFSRFEAKMYLTLCRHPGQGSLNRIDKVVIVTGASRGIGKDIAALFAAEGGKVICAARTVEEGTHPLEGSLNTTIQEIRDAGGEATAAAANISLPEDCEALVQAAHDIYGPVDVLVNKRGADILHPGEGLPAEPLDALVGGELPRSVHSEPACAGGHDTQRQRQHREYLVGRGDWTGARDHTRMCRRTVAGHATVRRRLRWNATPRDWRRKSISTAYR